MKKMNVRNLCVLGMLAALTIVLGFFATWRIGTSIKISLKFSSVYVAAALFGPLYGGITALCADIASFIANPVAGFIPLIALAEFLSGVIYGIFFSKCTFERLHISRVLLCCTFQAVFIDVLFKSFALSLSFGSDFSAMLVSRLPASVMNFMIQIIVISVINLYMDRFKSICYK